MKTQLLQMYSCQNRRSEEWLPEKDEFSPLTLQTSLAVPQISFAIGWCSTKVLARCCLQTLGFWASGTVRNKALSFISKFQVQVFCHTVQKTAHESNPEGTSEAFSDAPEQYHSLLCWKPMTTEGKEEEEQAVWGSKVHFKDQEITWKVTPYTLPKEQKKTKIKEAQDRQTVKLYKELVYDGSTATGRPDPYMWRPWGDSIILGDWSNVGTAMHCLALWQEYGFQNQRDLSSNSGPVT